VSVTTPPRAERPEIRHWWSSADVRRILVLWAVFTVLGIVFAVTVPDALMGTSASTTMTEVQRTFTVFSVASAPVAALVWAIGVHALWRWRRKGDWTSEDPDGPPLRGNAWANGVWIFGSSALCLFLLIWGLAALSAVDSPAAAADPLEVDVTGQQWVWSFSYPDYGNIETEQLYLPVNRPVVFKVTSSDVIHSFWLTQMGVKVDANPGMTTTTQAIPDRIGTYDVRCAELCGLLHADMETSVHVVSPRRFAAWAKTQGGTR
jgi:cytochrome c oxidase subunit II